MEPAVEDTDGRSVSDRTRPHFFFLWLLLHPIPLPGYRLPACYVMGYKAKGKWEALGHGACRRRYGRPERERSHKTSLFFSLASAPPDPPTGVPASGIGYGFYQV